KGFGYFPVLVSVGAISGLVILLVLYQGLGFLGELVGSWTNYGLYLAPLITLGLAFLVRPSAETGSVTLRGSTTTEHYFTLARLERFTSPGFPSAYVLLFGLFVGFVIGIVYWTPDHGGREIEGSFFQCVLLALDHICQVLTLGLLACFDIHVAGRVPASTLS